MKFQKSPSSKGSHSVTSAMLMAAGLGTRLSPFTNHETKALLPVMGVPIAQYTIDSLIHAGVEQLVANVHHQGSQSAEGLVTLEYGPARLVISDESQQLLGSAGGIKKALNNFGSNPFFLANADVLCEVDWTALAACHQRLHSEAGVLLTLTVFSAGPPGAKYREIHFDSATGLITSLGELAEGRPYFVGAAVLEPEALFAVPADVPSDFVQSILRPAIRKARAGVFVSQGSWFDIGEPKLWLKTHLALIETMERGQCRGNSSLLRKTGILDRILERIGQKNLRLSEGVWVSRDSVIKDCTQWKGPCYWNGNWNVRSELSDQKNGPAIVPQTLGPESVLYGPCVEGKIYTRGIGFRGEWIGML